MALTLYVRIIWWNYLKAFNVEGLRYCWHSLGELIASNNLLTSLDVADLSKFSRLFVLYLNGNDISNYHGLTSASPFKRFKTV
ncbi:hypothetical protein TrispH2_007670 [Trichoplax sp. H2]|nr:hypothetical protein TrispH2_007670 [Trichoplax sp. H2]|eukprot:RDD40248.1 hypothetical protein TrispH2_007670 [Trichoplax sp. H2]